ncbi:transcriptional regulator LysR family [Cupriavidus necator N-1]|jgi:LysR family glycine cleavage system transcriptional activator|uniref:Transcriptional regulator LysR family n=1 Tax=Cupriavidus necator (strain ATCC 43291 / DSM 13513 / CCUG 52238 / LMG 8453 / N-1) TaxID=1042878 RepID=G0F058_CUPNN|nr:MULTISPECIES: LysR substrate-binding domain-containing protein [Cupriavidus]AEI78894.1 transcriptional regulator LysR family [Cupriavidus necator N-1]EYS85990.1 LysR family transcriptional regulator [Cupriavidus sp. SK-4]MDX6012583.1 LysR substrate-binding domain-containing protein [Cupriavidus necator]
MRLHSPSMSELHAFAAAARLGSFTRAADELCVTQGAVSRAIARLEAHFAQPLLQRNAHRLMLTDAGQQLLDAVAEPLAAIEHASAALRAGDRRHHLTLSIVPTLASVWLVPRLPDFHRRHPEIRLDFVPYQRDEDLSGPSPDAAILAGEASKWPSLQVDYVVGREMVPVCHPDRARARREAGRWQSPAELLDEPLLYHTTAPANWQNWLQAAGVPNAAPRLSTAFDQVSILIQAVRADMGVAVLQRCLVRDEIAAGRVTAPFDLPISLQRGYFLCAPKERRDHPALTCFRDWLLETAAKDTGSGANTLFTR